MPLTLDAIEEKLNYVSKMLTMQQEHIIHLKQDLQKQKEASAATAQAAETVDAAATATTCGCLSPSWCQAVANGVPSTYCRFSQPMPARDAKPVVETVPPSEAGTRRSLDDATEGEWNELKTASASKAGASRTMLAQWAEIKAAETTIARAAYLRGFEAAKALLLAVKPEPERGPDNFLWVNVYQLDSGEFYSSEGYDRKEDAARCAQLDGKRKLCARVRVWFNEGQFDD